MSRISPQSVRTVFERGRDLGDGTGYHVTTPPPTYESYNRVYTGVKTPNFRNLKGRQLPVNPFSMTLTQVDDSQAMDSLVQKDGNGHIILNTLSLDTTGLLFSYTTTTVPSSSHNPRARDNAITKLIARAEADLQANLAQDIAQMNQTVSLIAGTAKRITSAIRSVRRGNIVEAAKALGTPPPRSGYLWPKGGKHPSATQNVANNWLELQYGWKPLLQDIDGSMRSLANAINLGREVRRVSASSTYTTTDRGTFANPWLGGGPPVGSWNYTMATTSKYVMRYRIDNHVVAFLAQTGFTNPLNLAWEILPYSFVADWFLPIGPYLESLSAFGGMVFVDGSVSDLTVMEHSASVSFAGHGNGEGAGVERVNRGLRRVRVVNYNRGRLTGFPRKEVPALKNPISTLHALNAIALMVQAFKL